MDAGWLYGELAADILEGKRKFYTLIQLASDVKVKDRRPVAIQYANNTTTSPVSKFLSEYVLLYYNLCCNIQDSLSCHCHIVCRKSESDLPQKIGVFFVIHCLPSVGSEAPIATAII